MKKWIIILTILLGVQLVLIVAAHLSGSKYEAFEAKETLLSFDPKAVDDIRIENGDGASVTLNKLGETWVLPETGDFPADEKSVTSMLERLSRLKKGWPVTTSPDAAARFKTADKDFERRLTLRSSGQVVGQLYMGTSPGFRKVHVRPTGVDEIYAVAFNTWEAPAEADGWIDKKRAAVKVEDLNALTLPGIELRRLRDTRNIAEKAESTEEEERIAQRGYWQLTDLAETEKMDNVKTMELLDKLADLSVQSVLGTELKPEYLQDKPVLEFQAVKRDGTPLDYIVSQPEGESYYVLKRSDLAYYFQMARFTMTPFLEAQRSELVKIKDASDEIADDGAGNPVEDMGASAEQTESENTVSDRVEGPDAESVVTVQ